MPPEETTAADGNSSARKSYSTGSLGAVTNEPCVSAAEIEAALQDVEKQIILETKVR